MDELEYDSIDNIKIFTGNTAHSKIKYDRQLAVLTEMQRIFKVKDNDIVTINDIRSSILTINGYINNLTFEENDVMSRIDKLDDPILMIGCNYSEKFNDNPKYELPISKSRKPRKAIKKRLRSMPGNGKYFGSQITFKIFNDNPDKSIHKADKTYTIYQCKLFRNGQFQIPGICKEDLSDSLMPINFIMAYLQRIMNPPVSYSIKYVQAIMRNYTSSLINKEVFIDIVRLEQLLIQEKSTQDISDIIWNLTEQLPIKAVANIYSYLDLVPSMSIVDIIYNSERYAGIVLKLSRTSLLYKSNKKTTLKLLRSNKINVDGSSSVQEAHVIYKWVQLLYYKYYNDIVLGRKPIVDLIELSSGDESIYDTEEEIEEPRGDDNYIKYGYKKITGITMTELLSIQ